MPFVQIVTRFQTKKRLTLWPQQTGALLQLISVIQNQGVIYEAIFKVLFEYECGYFWLDVILTFASTVFFLPYASAGIKN